MNVSRLIELSLKQLGVLAAGENAEANELIDAMDSLRGLLAQWATQRLYVYKSIIIDIPLTNGKATYLVGKIDGDCCEYEVSCCGVPLLEQPDIQAEISHISDRAWLDGEEIRLIRDLNNTASNVAAWYEVDEPNWKFHVLKSGSWLKIKALALPFDLCNHDELQIPPSYERPLILSLAVEIAPMFGIEPTQTLFMNQRQSIDMLKRSNSTPFYVKNDLPVGVRHGCD